MVKINYWFADGTHETVIAHSLASELALRYPNGQGVPNGMRIHRNGANITGDLLVDQSVAFSTEQATYDITVTPGEPLTIALVVISVIVAVVSLNAIPKIAAPENANRTQQSPNNSLSGRSNVARVNERAADIRGYVAGAYVDLLQLPYRKFRNGIEYEFIYGQISEGKVLVENIRDGDTLLSKIQGAGAGVYAPGFSPLGFAPYQTVGTVPDESLYVVVQSNEIDGVTLKAPNAGGLGGAVVMTATAGGVISVSGGTDFTTFISVGDNVTLTDFYVYSEWPGPSIQNDISGVYAVTAVTATSVTITTTPDWVAAFGGTTPQTIYQTIWRDRIDPDRYYTFDPGISVAYRIDYSPSINGLSAAGNVVGPVVISGYDRVWLNVVARSGLYKDDGTTVFPCVDGIFTVTIRELDIAGIPTGTVTSSTHTVLPNQDDPKNSSGITVDLAVPYARAEISVRRTGNTDTSFSGTVSDEIQWRDLYLVDNVTSIDVSNATTIHAQIKATESALRVKDRKLNCDVTRRVAEWNGVSWTGGENDPAVLFAPVLASICRDPLFGRMEDDEVDWVQLYALQDSMLAYYGTDEPLRVGYTFDSDKISAEEAIHMICDAVNVRPYRVGSVLQFWFEGPQAASAMNLGHRNKHIGSDERIRTYGPRDDKTGVELTYYNAAERSFDTVKYGTGVNPLRIELSCCITERGARIRAQREYAKLQYARIQHRCDVTAIGRLIAPGMRVDVVDNTRQSSYDGEIKGVDGLTLTISQPVELDVPSIYSISLTRADGSVQQRPIVSQPAPNKVTIGTPLAELPQVSRNADRTPYIIGTDDMRTAMAMIVVDVIPSDYDKVAVTFINYSDEYYANDGGTPAEPAPERQLIARKALVSQLYPVKVMPEAVSVAIPSIVSGELAGPPIVTMAEAVSVAIPSLVSGVLTVPPVLNADDAVNVIIPTVVGGELRPATFNDADDALNVVIPSVVSGSLLTPIFQDFNEAVNVTIPSIVSGSLTAG